MASIQRVMREHDAHAVARRDRAAHGFERGQFDVGMVEDCRLHVGPISFAKGKADCELRIEGGKLVQALELVIAAGARANVDRDPKLMV